MTILVSFGQNVAVGIVGPGAGLAQRVDLLDPIAVAIVSVSGDAASGIGHAGHHVEDRLVGVLRDVTERIGHLGAISHAVVFVGRRIAIGIGHGGKLESGGIVGVGSSCSIGRNLFCEIAVGIVLILPDITSAIDIGS